MKPVSWTLGSKIGYVLFLLAVQVIMWGAIGLVAGWWSV